MVSGEEGARILMFKKIKTGDKVWVTKRDGACTTGWYELCTSLTNKLIWCMDEGEAWASMSGIKNEMLYFRQSGTIYNNNIDCMLEQALATGMIE
jgi:hypothetical protein